MVQFSQSLLIGKLKAQEFNSLMTQTPSVVQAIAKGLGVTTAELKEMVDKGELSAQKMVEGLKKAESSVNDLYGKTSTTISGAMQNLATATEKWVGEKDKAIGVSNGLVNATNFLATNLDTIAPVLLNIGAAWAAIKLKERVQETYNTTVVTQQKAKSAVVTAQATLRQSQSELVFACSAMQSLQAQLQLARTEQERTIIRQRMKAQSAEIIALTNAERVATQNLAKAKKSANLLNGAMSALGGPIGLVTVGLTFGASALWEWYQSAEQATQKVIDFADELPRLKENLNAMNSIDLRATKAQLEESAIAQQREVEKLKRKVKDLQQEIAQTPTLEILEDDYGYQVTIDNTAKLAQLQRDLDKEIKKLSDSTQKLAETQATTATVTQQLADVSQNELDAIYQRLGITLIDVDRNSQDFNSSMLITGNTATQVQSPLSSMMDKIFGVGDTARASAKDLYVFSHVARDALAQGKIPELPKPDEKTQQAIDRIKRRNEINNAKGQNWVNKSVNDALINQGLDPTKADYAEMREVLTEQFQHQLNERNRRGERGSKDEAEKAAEKSREDYQKQFGEMSYRLPELKANTKDIEMFGQVSHYQEVKKLTEDIALNAEKYKNFGLEGIEQLKSLLSQIDGEHQKLEIAKFGYDNTQKIKAMEFELTLLGKTRSEQELLQYGYQLEQEAAKLRIGMTEENIAKLDEEIAKLKECYSILQQEQERKRSDPVEGIKSGWSDIENSVTDVAGNMQNITVNAFNNMSDALTDFVLTGKGNFRDMATSILKDIAAMTVKMLLFNAIKSGMSAFGGFSSGGFVGGDFATGGYTGDGGKFTPAGIVHKGEYVITKEATSRIGLDYLNYLNYGRRGFANGGGVAVPRVPSINHQLSNNGETHNSVTITVNIDKNGNAESSVEQQAQQGKQLGNLIQAKVLEVLSRERRVGGMLSPNIRVI
ncbi:phage tail tape measure protein, lambda family [Actinobacillus ureae ATCC 25976]|uniref:Phage tail tape measure protein, lambda family n=1 Tax=Actinobacillus ureae ATCC 25976 TaxID=887324 RepID=E8KGC6_9PAST|nr:phage tail tape measure protein, lambda family [Actinobacillus ureae ATCC 25976]